ncbi:LysR family transcriptional regulator [Candidatus Bathyarchaeota archaeon]|nr:LysR family transcriptional regulator [Candidatus Bathyarchaeota archaeon]
MSDPKPAFKLWLETEDGYVFGPGVYNLLIAIDRTGTLKEASQQLGMSYRYAWGLIKKAEEKLGEPLVDASKGGKLGGGSSTITETGAKYIKDFERIQDQWKEFRGSLRAKGIVVSVDGNEVIVSFESDLFLVKGDKVRLTKA